MERVAQIEPLLATTAGADVLSSDEIESFVRADDATVLVLEGGDGNDPAITELQVGNQPTGPVVGVSIAREFGDAEALRAHPYLHTDLGTLLERTGLSASEFPVGSVLVSCVATEHQGQGLGSKITYAAIDALVEDEPIPILQLEWDRPDNPSVEKLMEAGLTPLARFEDHFPAGWNCGYCHTRTQREECTCDLVAFRL